MIIGNTTSSFNGQRLKIARLYRNLSVSDLADKIGIKKQSISQFETGLTKPKVETELLLIRELQFPRSFFYQKVETPEVNKTFFRALSSASALDKKTQETKTQLVVEIYNFLCEYLGLPELDLPILDIANMDIEEIAQKSREYWGLGEKPIPNMVNLIENKGIIVSAFDVESDKIDAFTQVHDLKNYPQYCVVVGNNKKSAVRRNFDMAHELGHIILHSSIENIDELSQEQLREIENEANLFAAAFLMPKDAFLRDLITPTNIVSYVALKEKWHVSIGAMIIRAKSLGIIDMKQYQSLMKAMSYRKWRTKEPLDDKLAVPYPTLFTSAIEILFENNMMTPQSFMYNLSKYGLAMNSHDVEHLLSLKEDMLKSDVEPIVNIKKIISIKGDD